MWVESEVGGGSSFTFSLPTGRPGRDPTPTGAETRGGERGNWCDALLLVEDDEHSIDLLSLYVAEAGFDVAVARNGEEGLELARRLHPCGIILDIRLPGLDGWEFLARAKADPAIADVPVIIVSMVDERGKGLALGAADYLVKPVARGELLEALARATPLPAYGKVLAIDDDPMALELVAGCSRACGLRSPHGAKRRGRRRPGAGGVARRRPARSRHAGGRRLRGRRAAEGRSRHARRSRS